MPSPSVEEGSPRWKKRILKWLTGSIAFGSVVIIAIILRVQLPSIPYLVDEASLPLHPDVVMILGGGIKPDGTPNDALTDRLIVGERVSKLTQAPMLLTGDDGQFRGPEIAGMHKWLLDRGVSPDRIVIDGEGYRTYESCKRAAELFNLKKMVIITQRFHIGRAIYLCHSFDIESYGVTSDLQPYRSIVWFTVRDMLASVKAWSDINLFPPVSPVQTADRT